MGHRNLGPGNLPVTGGSGGDSFTRASARFSCFASTFGITRPTVDTRRSRSSSRRVMDEIGAVSVIP